ncbi:NAD(P)-binding domain-containing protein [Nakamurella lactea]|uniref:NAD(P)-binding domain-containing protein n=1 Tax=Nakamurella lactea TaxID=459515 RepID=UPI0004111B35|nr:NAD(P)-binding domain-containing protein [Nakamurella lactea]
MNISTAVVGLGNIGGPIAARIAGCGAPVVGVDGLAERRQDWAGRTGAPAVASLAEIDSASLERVLIVVRTTEQALGVLDEVCRAAAGRASDPAAGPLTVHLMTTLEAAAARQLGDLPAVADDDGAVRVLEQPVSGGSVGAAAGTLTVLSAGPIRPTDTEFLLSTVAGRVIDFDDYGTPTLVKLVNNALAALNTRSTAAMLLLAADLGLDVRRVKQVVDTSSGASTMGEMIDRFADDQAELLTKDVALLAGAVDRLPSVDLDPAALLADLAAVRELLNRQPGDPAATHPQGDAR